MNDLVESIVRRAEAVLLGEAGRFSLPQTPDDVWGAGAGFHRSPGKCEKCKEREGFIRRGGREWLCGECDAELYPSRTRTNPLPRQYEAASRIAEGQGYDTIHLAGHEWGSDVMKQVAMDHFAKNPDVDYALVHEHAGWHLGFRRDGSIWATANDLAHVTGSGPTYHQDPAQRTYGREIWREGPNA